MKKTTKIMIFSGIVLLFLCSSIQNTRAETVVQFTDSDIDITATIYGLEDSEISSKNYGNGIYRPNIPYSNISDLEFERVDCQYQKTINQLLLNRSEIPDILPLMSSESEYTLDIGVSEDWLIGGEADGFYANGYGGICGIGVSEEKGRAKTIHSFCNDYGAYTYNRYDFVAMPLGHFSFWGIRTSTDDLLRYLSVFEGGDRISDIVIDSDKIKLQTSSGDIYHSFDPSIWHHYRIGWDETSIYIHIDNVLVLYGISANPYSIGITRLRFFTGFTGTGTFDMEGFIEPDSEVAETFNENLNVYYIDGFEPDIFDSAEIKIEFGFDYYTLERFHDYIEFTNESYTIAMSNEVVIPAPTFEYIDFTDLISKKYISIHTETMLLVDDTPQSHQKRMKRVIIYQSDNIIDENPEFVIEFEKLGKWISGTYFDNDYCKMYWENDINTKENVLRYRFLHSLNFALSFSELDNIFNVNTVFINDPYILPDDPDLPEFPESDEPDLPYWNYQSYSLISESSRTIEYSEDYSIVNQTDESETIHSFEFEYVFDDLSVESTTNKYFYNKNTISPADWGDWGINNWMRNLLVVLVNAIVYLFQMIMFLLTVAFQFLLLQPILYITVLVWNFPIYWVMFGVIGIVFYLIFVFVWLWEMASRFLYWLWKDIILPIWEWIMEHIITPAWEWIVEQATLAWDWFKTDGVIWMFETIILVIAFLLTVVLYVITFGALDWDTTIELIYDLIYELNTVFIGFVNIFMKHGIILLQYIVIYNVLVAFLAIKMIYAKSRGYVARAERLQTAINVFKLPITFTVAIFQTLIGFLMAKSESSNKE